MNPDAIGGVLYSDAGRYDRSPIAALCGISLVANARHQLRPCARDTLNVPPVARRLIRKAIAWKRRTNQMKCVGRVAAMSSRIRQRLDHFLKLDDRSRPSVRHHQRK